MVVIIFILNSSFKILEKWYFLAYSLITFTLNLSLFTYQDIEDNIGLLGCPGIFLSLFLCSLDQEKENVVENYNLIKRVGVGITVVAITFFIIVNIELHFLAKNFLVFIVHLWVQKYSVTHFRYVGI